ncbi:hypothetical protein AAZX31_15G248500 [Glycine max]
MFYCQAVLPWRIRPFSQPMYSTIRCIVKSKSMLFFNYYLIVIPMGYSAMTQRLISLFIFLAYASLSVSLRVFGHLVGWASKLLPPCCWFCLTFSKGVFGQLVEYPSSILLNVNLVKGIY